MSERARATKFKCQRVAGWRARSRQTWHGSSELALPLMMPASLLQRAWPRPGRASAFTRPLMTRVRARAWCSAAPRAPAPGLVGDLFKIRVCRVTSSTHGEPRRARPAPLMDTRDSFLANLATYFNLLRENYLRVEFDARGRWYVRCIICVLASGPARLKPACCCGEG